MSKCAFCNGTGQVKDDEPKKRTVRQNRAYFGLAVQRLADKYQVEKSTMHKALAGAYFGFEDVDLGQGLVMKVPASTSGRTTKEFMEFFDYIQKIAAERGVDIQSPNEPPPSYEGDDHATRIEL